jgi:hypothetical protein
MKKALVVLTIVLVALSFGQAAQALVIDVMFDGYCDGMHLNIISGTGLVDGNRIGDCLPALDPLTGTVGNVITQGTAVTVHFDNGIQDFIMVVRQNGTWTLYTNDGGGIYVFNQGTWSNALAAGAAGATATTD